MLAAHRDQENLIHEQQTAAAAKPLNQSVRGLGPKTPGNNNTNKTFNAKVPLKSGGQGDENTVFGRGKTVKADKNAFVTPVAPRERAPLGAKTTNAKATAFQTPAPLTGGQGLQKTQRPSASARKHKLKIHQPETIEADPIAHEEDDDDDSIPDIEYCPPKITELPDIPDDPNAFGPDKTFPQFQGDNAFRGWYSLYMNPIGQDGLSKREREAKEQTERARAWSEQVLMQSLEREFQDESADLEDQRTDATKSHAVVKPIHTYQPAKPPPSTLNARSAADALSKKPQPSYAAPTAAAQAKKTIAAAKRNGGAAYSTIGYAKGRKVSSSLRQQQEHADSAKASSSDRPNAQTNKEGELISELMQRPFDVGHEDDDDLMFPSSLRGRDLFAEEASKPFVLCLPDHEE